MSSSAPERFPGFLTRSFELLAREMPDAYGTMCRHLAPREVTLEVDGDVVPLAFDRHGVRFLMAPHMPAIAVRTTRRAILRVLDAEASLLDAVLDETLLLRGGTDDLLAFHDGLVAYVHGAVRAPSFPRLLRSYRSAGEARP